MRERGLPGKRSCHKAALTPPRGCSHMLFCLTVLV